MGQGPLQSWVSMCKHCRFRHFFCVCECDVKNLFFLARVVPQVRLLGSIFKYFCDSFSAVSYTPPHPSFYVFFTPVSEIRFLFFLKPFTSSEGYFHSSSLGVTNIHC